MRRRTKYQRTAIALLLAVTFGWIAVSRGEEAVPLSEDTGPWQDHAACSLLGPQRETYMAAALGMERRIHAAQAQLTSEVVAQLGGSALAPRRSRSGEMLSTTPSGPITGDSIDDFVFGLLEQKRIAPAPLTTDAEFLRRVSIDLTGRIPTLQETAAFLQDTGADKRERAIDRLLASPAWVDRWTLFLGDLFRNTQATAQVNRYPGGRDALHLFLRDSLAQNKPYDQLVREMLASGGANDGRPWPAPPRPGSSPFSSFDAYQAFLRDNPASPQPSSYIVGGRTTGGPVHDTYDALAANIARDLLGISHMDCILCHDGAGHLESLNVWGAEAKRSEGWGLAAFFQRVLLARPGYRVPARDGSVGPVPPYYIVQELNEGQVLRNRRGVLLAGEYSLDTSGGNRPDRIPSDFGGQTAVAPRYPFGGGEPRPGEPYRAALGRLLTADPQFARATVNYVWREFFGCGFVEPADQFDLARLDPTALPPGDWEVQPSHPELLDFLAEGLVKNGFDLHWLMREITRSETYQLSSRYEGAWSPTYEPYLARHAARRLNAEALFDAVTLATMTPFNLPLPNLTQRALGPLQFAMQLPDVQNMPTGGRDRPEGPAASMFLDAFFRGDREETPRSSETSILQALQLMNSPLVVERIEISASRGIFAQWLDQPDDTLVGLLYLQVLSRQASPEEIAAGVGQLRSGDRRDAVEDLAWTLMNKVDFVFNY